MKIALIPGTFNPIHKGHIAIAEHQKKLGEVPTFIISTNPFDKEGVVSPIKRLDPITKLGFYATIVESKTILGQLTEIIGQHYFRGMPPPQEISVNVGMDTFIRINNKDYYYDPLQFKAFCDVLRIEKIKINVFPRPNSIKPTVEPELFPNVNFVENFEQISISSTELRSMKCGLS